MKPNGPSELTQLGERLKHSLYQANGAPIRPSRFEKTRALVRRSPVTTAACVLAGMAGVGIAVAATSNGRPVTPQEFQSGTTAIPPTTVPTRLAASFSILNRPITASDALPEAFIATHQHSPLVRFVGANLALARRVNGLTHGAAWVIPGASSICLSATESNTGAEVGGSACRPDSAALKGTIVLTLGGEFIAGLVPDGVNTVVLNLADGSSETLAVHENVYTTSVSTTPTTIQYTGPNGPVTINVS